MTRPKARRRKVRTAESYRANTPESKARKLAGLKQYSQTTGKVKLPASFCNDPIGFIESEFYVIETRSPIVLLDHEKELITDLFLRKVKPNLAVIGEPKKCGKSTFAAAIALWFLCCKPFSEVYLLASDVQQTALVCFDKLCKSIRMNPRLRKQCHIKSGKGRVDYDDSFVQILAPNTSVAGINPSLIVAEELWSWTTTEHKRSWDELTNVPTREVNLNLITSYAGYSEDEDSILWELYKKGIDQAEGKEDKDPRFLFRWWGVELYEKIPWVKPSYLKQQKRRLRENSFKRLHCNAWTSGLEVFIDAEIIDICTNPDYKRGQDFKGRVAAGIDIGTKHDTSGIVLVGGIDDKTLGIIDHSIFIPSGKQTLDLEKTVETTMEFYDKRYDIAQVYFDPYQAIRSAQALKKKGIYMQEFPPTIANLVKMADTLQGLLKTAALMLYENQELRQHLLNAKVKEHTRGWRLVKGRQSKKIDLAIALAMACQAAQDCFLSRGPAGIIILDDDEDESGVEDWPEEIWTPHG